LKKKGYKVVDLDAKGYFVDELKQLKPKIVFNALHGKYGEDGFVQSILESLKIPYTHSGVLSSSLAMDKELSRLIFIKNNLKVPKYFLLQKDHQGNSNKKFNNKKIKFPIVIKPINEGSSLGVSICKNKKQFTNKYKKLMENYDRILVEEYIPGREIQVAVMGEKALGAIELVPRRQFYDYTAKYSNTAQTQHIMPAPLSPKKYKEILGLAKKAHELLGCRGITRSDFRFFKNKFYLLETNTQPGLTKLSLVPEIAQYCGIKFEDLIVWMTENASSNK
jgi:D-alanine-D-alanine ligase